MFDFVAAVAGENGRACDRHVRGFYENEKTVAALAALLKDEANEARRG